MRGLFVTAIGADCGKTHVSCALLRELKTRGGDPLPLKPLMSGFAPGDIDASDAGRLLAACGRAVTNETISQICWKSFMEPSAPNVAARRAGVDLDYREMLAFVRDKIAATDDASLLEGAGGVMSPLTDECTNLDLMADLDLPVLLLAANYLGAVTHTLTALAYCKDGVCEPLALWLASPGRTPARQMSSLENWRDGPRRRSRLRPSPEARMPIACGRWASHGASSVDWVD